jgi:hypothetical protein
MLGYNEIGLSIEWVALSFCREKKRNENGSLRPLNTQLTGTDKNSQRN